MSQETVVSGSLNHADKQFSVKKRDGSIVNFDKGKITEAILKAATSVNEYNAAEASEITDSICEKILELIAANTEFIPTVEVIQDVVERELMAAGKSEIAKAYILYRAERSKLRPERVEVSERLKSLADESKGYFKDNPLGLFVYLRTYARWIESEQRRETWVETVDRYMDFMKENLGDKLTGDEYAEVRMAILKQEVMPSMRAMQFSGAPARRCNVSFFNCSFTVFNRLKDFADAMYLSMSGTGVGFSVEAAEVNNLPVILEQTGEKLPVHAVGDSREGWCDALLAGMSAWYEGKDVEFDYSGVRPQGTRLKITGGKSSGPDPLKNCLNFTRETILKRQGQKLSPLQVHDIVCKIGECVVAGGVRRCLPKGTFVHMEKGLIRIEDVKVGQKVKTSSGFHKVSENIYQGIQPISVIKTEVGELHCTDQHKIAVVDTLDSYVWKQARELVQGDRLVQVVAINEIKPVVIESIIHNVYDAETYDLSVPDVNEFVIQDGLLVHNSALISLSDLNDPEMRDAKKGQFYLTDMQRSMANNSAVYLSKPSAEVFLDEWTALVKSKSGERGIFNRGAIGVTMPERRVLFLENKYGKIISQVMTGVNPCSEIILQPRQFCNLSEVIARHHDTEETLIQKIRIATLLGTYQTTLTNFNYIAPEWAENTKEERLLGVSITGQWDCPAVRKPETFSKLRQVSIDENRRYSDRFGINYSTSITACKPSGSVSKTFDTASGIHTRFAPYYIQRIRISASDSLFKMLRDQGVKYHPEVGQELETAHTMVLEFPIKSPEGSKFKNELTAIDQLEYWKMVKINYTEHNPSVTISVGDDEWVETGAWVYKNWDIVGGLSFLPRSDHVYQLAPMEECTKETYEEMKKQYENIDYSQIMSYEKIDNTDVKKELACVAGVCSIDDIVGDQAKS
jgi:ATP cone domain/Ribonucleotide reductase alpha domain